MQTLNLVRILLHADYRVTVCCYYEFDTSIVSQMEQTGAKVTLMKLKRVDGMLSLIIRLKKLLKEVQPDIIHIQYVAPGFLPIIAARLAKVPTIFATVHQPGRVYNWKAKLILRTAAKLCTAFFCNSKSVEESWFGDGELYNPEKNYQGRKHFTIYNGVDVDSIEKKVKSADRKRIKESLNIGNKKVIGVVGRLRSEKGQEILLKAMVDVIKVCPDSILLVVGDGPDRAHLEQVVRKLGIEGHVFWLGQRTQREVFELYSIMDVMAVPSIFEGFGLTAAEAMAAMVPVVASRVDGLTEVIENDVAGVLVSTGDSAALASALTGLLSDGEKAREMGQKGQERVRELFSLEKFSQATQSVYRELPDNSR
jgi:L-malate glycosyltransferase